MSQASLNASSSLDNSDAANPGFSGSGEDDFKKRPIPVDATRDEKAHLRRDDDNDQV